MQTNCALCMHAASPERRILVDILVERVHLILSVVVVMEQVPDKASSDETRHSQTNVHPLDLGVDEHRVECLGDGGSKGVGEEVHGLHERLHGGRGLGVGVLEAGDRCKNLRDTDEHVRASLGGNVDVVAVDDAVNLCSRTERVVVARSGLVDEVLDDCCVDHSKRCNPETADDTVDRGEWDLVFAECRHEDLIDERQENDDSNGIEVLHQIVGNAVESHLSTLGDEVVRKLTVDNPVNRIKAEDLAGNQSTLDLLDEVIIPAKDSSLSETSLVRRLCAIELAGLDHHPDNAEGISDDRALWRSNNVNFAPENKDERTNKEDAKTQQEGRPEIDIALHVRGREQRETADVDAEVEHHVDPLDGDRRVDNDLLSSLVVMANDHTPPLILVCNKGSNVRFDTTSSKTNNNDSDDESTETSTVIQSSWYRRACQDKETDHVDSAEDENGVVLSEVLIGNDSTQNGRNVAPELEKRGKTGSSLMTHAESTTAKFTTAWTCNVVLEKTRGAIVCEALAKFDDGDEESSLWERLADLTKSSEFFGSGRDSTQAIVLVIGHADRCAGAVAAIVLDDFLLVINVDVGANIIVVQGCAKEMGLGVCLNLRVLQLLSAGGC